MSTKSTARWDEDLKEIFDEHFPEGLVRTLAKKFPGATSADYEDAVASGFEKLAKKGPTDNPRGYVTTVAVNALKRHLKALAMEELEKHYEDDDGDEHAQDNLPRGIEWEDPVLDEVVAERIFEFMRDVVRKWENASYKQATMLIIEAARYGEPIDNTELAERLGEILGQEVEPDTVRQWRKRGLDRLRRALIEAELLTNEVTT